MRVSMHHSSTLSLLVATALTSMCFAEEGSLENIDDAILARPYRIQLAFAVEGTAPFTYAIGGDARPSCLAVDPLTGVLHGTPTRACLGNHRLHIVITDYKGQQSSRDFLLHITEGRLSPKHQDLPLISQESYPAAKPNPAGVDGATVADSGAWPRSQPVVAGDASHLLPSEGVSHLIQSRAAYEPNADTNENSEQDATVARLSQAVGSLHRTAFRQPVKRADAASSESGAPAAKNTPRPEDADKQPPEGKTAPGNEAEESPKEDGSAATVSTFIDQCEAEATTDFRHESSLYINVSTGSDPATAAQKDSLRTSLLNLRDSSAHAADCLKLKQPSNLKAADKASVNAHMNHWKQLNDYLVLHQDDIDSNADIGDLLSTPFLEVTPQFLQRAETFGIVGTTLSAASDISPAAKLFAELYGDVPLVSKDNYGLRAWSYGRIGSIVQTTAAFSSNAISSTLTQALKSSSQSMVQSGEFTAGMALRLPFSQRVAVGPSLSAIVGAGAITAMTAPSTQASAAYYVTPQIYNYYSGGPYGSQLAALCGTLTSNAAATTNNCYVTFYPQDRSRFFRHYEAGLRLKFPLSSVLPGHEKFPATFDFTAGQNEYVTGGKLNGAVVHFGGTAPLVYTPGVYAFGGVDLGVNGPGDQPGPLLFPNAPTGFATPSTSNTVNIQLPQPNRDRYTIGLGFDLLQVLKAKNPKAE